MYELLSTFGIFVIISALQLSILGTWNLGHLTNSNHNAFLI